MSLTVKKLQKFVQRALEEERLSEIIKNEFKRALGLSLTESKFDRLIESANSNVDVFDSVGKLDRNNFKTSVFVRLLEHDDSEVRLLAAKLVPSRFLVKLVNDRSPLVRLEAAKRLPHNIVQKMSNAYPNDESLNSLCKSKKLLEAGIPQPTKRNQHLEMHNKKRLGAVIKQNPGPDLSELWYAEQAKRFMQDYGGNIEDSWEEIATRRYCSSVKSSFGIDIDEVKLLKAIKKLISDREERVLKRTALKETVDWLQSQSEYDVYQESDFTVSTPTLDEKMSAKDLIKTANKMFNIKYTNLPIGSYNSLSESSSAGGMIPVQGKLTQSSSLTINDERSLDAYCSAWNSKQSLCDDSLKVSWSIHPHKPGVVLFSVSKK